MILWQASETLATDLDQLNAVPSKRKMYAIPHRLYNDATYISLTGKKTIRTCGRKSTF